jgi:hypothetical protein
MNYFERFYEPEMPGDYRGAWQRLGVNCRLFPALGFWSDWSKPLTSTMNVRDRVNAQRNQQHCQKQYDQRTMRGTFARFGHAQHDYPQTLSNVTYTALTGDSWPQVLRRRVGLDWRKLVRRFARPLSKDTKALRPFGTAIVDLSVQPLRNILSFAVKNKPLFIKSEQRQ